MRASALRSISLTAAFLLFAHGAVAQVQSWRGEWPRTDFGRHAIALEEIRSVIGKDRIPAIDEPKFIAVAAADHLADVEPVIGLVIGGEARAYPLQMLMWHEIVNDTVGGVPVAVTFCPLCNTTLVFDRRIDGRVLDFGTTGKLRNSDLVMYDRQTESWWQQFMGEAIVGELTGSRLEMVPARVESFANFKARFPEGRVLVPADPRIRRYGVNPYARYDTLSRPMLYDGALPSEIAPLARIVRVGETAWSLDLLRARREIRAGDLILRWSPGQASALDTAVMAEGADIGNVTVERVTGQGLVDVPYTVDFAFAFRAFYPDGAIHLP